MRKCVLVVGIELWRCPGIIVLMLIIDHFSANMIQ